MDGLDEVGHETTQDWKALNSKFADLRIGDEAIPRRNEKDFDVDGSTAQERELNDARSHMYAALNHVRGHHIKNLIVGVWIKQRNQLLVPHAKGRFFDGMGTAHLYPKKPRMYGVWLDPVEAVYMVERGSLIAYEANEAFLAFMEDDQYDFSYDDLRQYLLSHLYSVVFTERGLLEQYQVYALLKRLGYTVLPYRKLHRYEELEDLPKDSLATQGFALVSSLGCVARSWSNDILKRLFPAHNKSKLTTTHFWSYTDVFEALQVVDTKQPARSTESRYQLHFNVWKPAQAFQKKNPPTPDFEVSVVNIAHTLFPTHEEQQYLFSQLNKPASSGPAPKKPASAKQEARDAKRKEREAKMDPVELATKKYLHARSTMLRNGTGRSVVLAMVNDGRISCYYLNETLFALKKNKELELLRPGHNHGLMWSEL